MPLESLIKNPILTRELDFELSGISSFLNDELRKLLGDQPWDGEIEEFKSYSTKVKLLQFTSLYNDLEGFLMDTCGQEKLLEFRKGFRMKFPYLASLDQMVVFFLPSDRQPCVLNCFFVSEILCRIMDVYGQSKKLTERYHQTDHHYRSCKTPQEYESSIQQAEIHKMPEELFKMLQPTLGKNPVLNLYQRTFDKLQSQYSNLPSFVFLHSSLDRIFSGQI